MDDAHRSAVWSPLVWVMSATVLTFGLVLAGQPGDQSTTPQTAATGFATIQSATFTVSWLVAEVPIAEESKLKITYAVGDTSTLASAPTANAMSPDPQWRSWSVTTPFWSGQPLHIDAQASPGLNAQLRTGVQINAREMRCTPRSRPMARTRAYCHVG